MADAYPDFTPVNLVTGFLGSGKTTLIGRLLRDPALGDTAVLINEFGEVGLDHHLMERIDETMVLLQSGCLCCTIRGELSEAIGGLHARREAALIPPFRRLVIESTGLADPFPILSTVHADPVLKHHFVLGNVISTVDAVNGDAELDAYEESVKQAAIADRLVITKTDLADADAAQLLALRLRALNPAAPLLRTQDRIDARLLLSEDAFGLAGKSRQARSWFESEMEASPGREDSADRHGAHGQEPGHRHEAHHHDVNRHGKGIASFSLSFEEPLDWTMFGLWLTMLLNRHGAQVLRVKGILNIEGETTPVAVHGVQHLVHAPRHMPAWPDADRRSRLVFITRDLDAGLIRRSLDAFMKAAAPARAAGASAA
jgi:G3E family GTPase